MLAHIREREDVNQYGVPTSEATSADANPSVAGGWKYVPNPKPTVDYSALAVHQAMDAWYKAHPKTTDAERSAHRWIVRRHDMN